MADADEDVIPRGITANESEEPDLSDETQDFRFLSSISKESATIPKRGAKDFEPHATELQSNTLTASRQAMHNALSYPRFHPPKGSNIGIYHPRTNMVYTMNPKGPLFSKMGRVCSARDDPLGKGLDPLRGQRIWLYPEEALYLIERGTLDVRWPVLEEGEDDGDDELGLPMSLQGAYAMFLGDNEFHLESLTFERYSVYSGLKRMGYTVLRAPSWNNFTTGSPGPECFPPPLPGKWNTWQTGLLDSISFWRSSWWLQNTTEEKVSKSQSTGPLIPNGLYRTYNEIYRRLALINFHDPPNHFQHTSPPPSSSTSDFKITFHIHKPASTTFKKSSPGPPDFRISVLSARSSTPPSLQELSSLMDFCPYEPPKEGGHVHAKFKNGWKNVVVAVVDMGVVSYLRVADAGFGKERVFERRVTARGGKRGGGGGREGRGGGRGGQGRGRGK